MAQPRRLIEVVTLAGAVIVTVAGFLWTTKQYIEDVYQRKTDAIEAHVQLQIDALEGRAVYHALPANDAIQLEQLRQIRSKIQGLE